MDSIFWRHYSNLKKKKKKKLFILFKENINTQKVHVVNSTIDKTLVSKMNLVLLSVEVLKVTVLCSQNQQIIHTQELAVQKYLIFPKSKKKKNWWSYH